MSGRAGSMSHLKTVAMFLVAHVFLWTILPLVIYPAAPLDVYEVTYWGHEWQWGYWKHPPLTSWLAEIARAAGGSSGLGLYLVAQLSVALGFYAVWKLASDLLDPGPALLSVALLEGAGFYTWFSLEWNHSVNLFPFWCWATFSFFRALKHGRLGWWMGTGLAVGFGFLAKYTIILLVLAMVIFMLVHPRARPALRSRGPWMAAATALLVALPHLAWMVERGFPTLTYAMGRLGLARSWYDPFVHPAEFLLGQVAYLLPALVVGAWMVRGSGVRYAADQDDRFDRWFLLAMTLLPGVLLALAVGVGATPRTAWGMPCWGTIGVLILHLFAVKPTKNPRTAAWVLVAVLGSVNAVMVVGEEIGTPLVKDRGTRKQFPAVELATRINAEWLSRYDSPLERVGGNWWRAAQVNFHVASRPTVLTDMDLEGCGIDEQACPWTSIGDFRRHGGVLLWDADRHGAALPECLLDPFPDADAQPVIALEWRTLNPLPATRVGWAIVAPHGGTTIQSTAVLTARNPTGSGCP